MSSKKEQIFQSVIHHIKTKGLLNNLTISEIAKSADVGKGTVYEYFSSKDEMIAETIIFMIETSRIKIMNQKIDSLDFENALRNHIRILIDNIHENASFHTMLMSQELGGVINKTFKQKIMNKMMAIKGQYRSYLQMIIDKGIKEGIITETKDDPFIIVTIGNLIMTSIMYFIHETNKIDTNKDEVTDKIYTIILKLLK